MSDPKRPRGRPRVPDAERAAQVELRVSPALLARLDAVVEQDRAEADDPAAVTRASVVRCAVEEYVARREDDAREASVPMGDTASERVRRREALDLGPEG